MQYIIFALMAKKRASCALQLSVWWNDAHNCYNFISGVFPSLLNIIYSTVKVWAIIKGDLEPIYPSLSPSLLESSSLSVSLSLSPCIAVLLLVLFVHGVNNVNKFDWQHIISRPFWLNMSVFSSPAVTLVGSVMSGLGICARLLDTERWARSWSRCTVSQPAGNRKSSTQR